MENPIYFQEGLNARISSRKADFLLNNPPYNQRINVAYAKNTLIYSLVGSIIAAAYKMLRNKLDNEDINKDLLKTMAVGAVAGAGVGTIHSIRRYDQLKDDLSQQVASKYNQLYYQNKTRATSAAGRLFSTRAIRKQARKQALRDLNNELISYKGEE